MHYVQLCYPYIFFNKFYKKTRPVLQYGYKSKVMPQPHYLSLFLGQGKGSLQPYSLKTLITQKCIHLSSFPLIPQQHTCFDTPSVPVVHYKIIPCFAFEYMYFSHLFCKFHAFPVTKRHKILHHHFSL